MLPESSKTTRATKKNAVPLKGQAKTGKDNVVRTKPFIAIAVLCQRQWKPIDDGPLPVEFYVHNPNARAEFGRLVYVSPPVIGAKPGSPDSRPLIVHQQSLRRDQITDGRHELAPKERWNGFFTEGVGDRVGIRVTVDHSPIRVVLQLWNRNADPPPLTDRENENLEDGRHVSTVHERTFINDVVEARWDRRWVIPHGDPDEPEYGEAKMDVRVQGLADGTPVRFRVERIVDVADPWSAENKTYVQTGQQPDDQPGLEGAVVTHGRVVLADGTQPFVRFNIHDEHWKYPGNNFYAFWVAFGERGRFHPASERRHDRKENDCLHMRFTVFVHRSAGNLGHSKLSARKLHKFLRSDTKYYRSYLMEGAPQDADDWVKHWRHRYIVVVVGHAACYCTHDDHPRKETDPDEFLEMMHSSFPPDDNVCPNRLEPFSVGQFKADLKKYKQDFMWGCGHKSHVTNWSGLGRVSRNEKYVVYNAVGGKKNDLILSRQSREAKRRSRSRGWKEIEQTALKAGDAPRLMFYNGGCRTMLTTNFGGILADAGTRFHCGWVYSVLDKVDGRFLPEFFKRWIKGTRKDPAAVEFDVERIPDAYRQIAKRGGAPDWNPRIMDSSGVLNPNPGRYESLLE